MSTAIPRSVRIKCWLKWKKKAVFMFLARLLGYRFKRIGKRVFCLGTRSVFLPNSVELGDYTFINRNACFLGLVKVGLLRRVRGQRCDRRRRSPVRPGGCAAVLFRPSRSARNTDRD